MALARVEITQGVLLSAMTHAFTTEGEEVMGLLLGDVTVDASGAPVSRIWMAYPQIRTDRRKDRVETSPEQMARCTAHAERLSKQSGLHTRIVGWYHSHPHITVHPSHVDVKTQSVYQMLDPCFVGLIFSVFNTDSTGSQAGQVQVTAFQSVPANHPEAAHDGATWGGASELVSYSSEALAGFDTPTKQAIRASAQDAGARSASVLARREVPLTVVGPRNPAESSLLDLVAVQHILAMEERQAYNAAQGVIDTSAPLATPNTSGGGAQQQHQQQQQPVLTAGQALRQLHAAGLYQEELTRLLDITMAASVVGLRSLAVQQSIQVQQLTARNAALKDMLARRQAAAQQGSGSSLSRRNSSQQALAPRISHISLDAGRSSGASTPSSRTAAYAATHHARQPSTDQLSAHQPPATHARQPSSEQQALQQQQQRLQELQLQQEGQQSGSPASSTASVSRGPVTRSSSSGQFRDSPRRLPSSGLSQASRASVASASQQGGPYVQQGAPQGGPYAMPGGQYPAQGGQGQYSAQGQLVQGRLSSSSLQRDEGAYAGQAAQAYGHVQQRQNSNASDGSPGVPHQ